MKYLITIGLVILFLSIEVVIQLFLGVVFGLCYIIYEILQNPEFDIRDTSEMLKALNQHSMLLRIISYFWSAGIYALIFKFSRLKILDYIELKKLPSLQMVYYALLGMIINGACQIFLISIESSGVLSDSYQRYVESMTTLFNNNIFVLIFVVGILAPLLEEFLFRGLIMAQLRKVFNIHISVFVQAILFGVFHLSIVHAIYTSVTGIVLGYICYKTKSIVAPVIIHMSLNTTSVILLNMNPGSPKMYLLYLFIFVVVAIFGLAIFSKFYKKNILEQKSQEQQLDLKESN